MYPVQSLFTSIDKILCTSKLELAKYLTSMVVLRPGQQLASLGGSGC